MRTCTDSPHTRILRALTRSQRLAESAFALAILVAGSAGAIGLTVDNSSFETGAPGAYSTSPPTFYPALGWTFGCSNPAACGESGIVSIAFAPNGSQAGYTSNGGVPMQNAFIAQEIAPIVPGAEYNLSVMVGHAPGKNLNSYQLALGYNATPHDRTTNVQFHTVLFNAPGDIPAESAFILASITGIAPAASAGGWLTISFASGSYVLWDQASVAPVPLPAALPLFATILAGGGLIAWRRKQKAAKLAA